MIKMAKRKISDSLKVMNSIAAVMGAGLDETQKIIDSNKPKKSKMRD